MTNILKAPFPWFGGKSRVAHIAWPRLGCDVYNYVEPFFGSGAVLLGRPGGPGSIETVNDLDGYVANFWRAIQSDPEQVAHYADWPVNENDLHARHVWLVDRKDSLQSELEGDMDYFDPKIAGLWVWGICSWISGGWCSGKGPWWPDDQGRLVKESGRGQGVKRTLPHLFRGKGVNRQLPHLGRGGQGVNRQRPHLGTSGIGVKRQRPDLGGGRGVRRQRPHLGDAGQGVNRKTIDTIHWFHDLSDRLRRVRVCSGDWSRVCGPSPTTKLGITAVFLDPPYADTAKRCSDLYTQDSQTVAHEVRKWAIENGDNPKMRIALCGYEGEHVMPDDWVKVAWKAHGGYGAKAGINSAKERIWFSPHCLQVEDDTIGQLDLTS